MATLDGRRDRVFYFGRVEAALGILWGAKPGTNVLAETKDEMTMSSEPNQAFAGNGATTQPKQGDSLFRAVPYRGR